MRLPITTLRGALLGLLLAGLQACTHRAEELPIPAPSGPALVAGDAQIWYQSTITSPSTGSQPAAGTSAQATTRSANPASPVLRWDRTRTVGQGADQLLLVPFSNDAALFAHSSHAGTRYLVVTRAPAGPFEGNILELLLRRTAAPVDTTALFAALYRNGHNGFLAPVSGDGLMLLYSADYQYLTGRRFRNGHFLAGPARLAFQRRPDGSTGANAANRGVAANGGTTTNFTEMGDATCTDWYDGNSGEYITSTGNCGDGGGTSSGGYEPPYTGPGTTGPGGYDPNPASGGGGSNGSTQVGSTGDGIAADGPLSVGDYSKDCKVALIAGVTDIHVLVEATINQSIPKIEKLTLTASGGVSGAVKQVGDGTGRYDPVNNAFTFTVYYQVNGTVASSRLERVEGVLYLNTGRYVLRRFSN